MRAKRSSVYLSVYLHSFHSLVFAIIVIIFHLEVMYSTAFFVYYQPYDTYFHLEVIHSTAFLVYWPAL